MLYEAWFKKNFISIYFLRHFPLMKKIYSSLFHPLHYSASPHSSFLKWNILKCSIIIQVKKVQQPYSSPFILFIYPSTPTSILPLTWPVLHSYSSLFKCLIIGWDLLWHFPVNVLCLNKSSYLITLPHSFTPTL
jgi:hypothetical protein